MWIKFKLFEIRNELLLNESLTKNQIFNKIIDRLKGKNVGSNGIEKFYKYVLYKKFNNNTVIESEFKKENASNIKKIEGYTNMIKQEEYVTRLITEKYKKETSISNWKMNLDFLKMNYSSLVKDENIDIDLVNSYIGGYSFIDNVKDYSNIKTKKRTKTISTYSPEKAVEYAITYAFNYNTSKYPSYAGKGGDCANFISQALHAGGKPMMGTNSANFNNWFCRSNQLWDVDKISSTWRGADAFGDYWMTKAVSFKDFDGSYFNDSSKFKKILSYGHRGDAVSLLNSNGRPFHTLIIIDYDKEDLICAAHSNNTINASLRIYGSFSGARIYKMSD